MLTPTLVVDDGIHRSARVPIPMGQMNVGADTRNATVLSDSAAATAFRLRSDGRSIVLVAVDCDAVVDGKKLRRGRERRFKRPSSFVSGGIAFSIQWACDPVVPRNTAHRQSPRAFAAGVIATLTLGGIAAIVAAPSPPAAWLRPAEAAHGDVTGSIQAVRTPAPIPAAFPSSLIPDRSSDTLLVDMRRKLAASGLDGVSIETQPDGGIAAAGRITPTKKDTWHAVVRWFDTAAAGQAILIDRVEVATAAATLQVQALYAGRTPYIIDGEGQKLFIGATLSDGSVIQKIESQGVLLKRGDQVVAVRF